MQSLSIWHWIIIAVLIVLVVAAIWLFARAINQRRPDERSVKDRSSVAPVSGPSGFGGWLVVLAIGVFVSPIVTIAQLINNLPPDNDPLGAELHYMFDGDIILHLAVIVLEICTLVFMMRRSKNFIPFYIASGLCIVLLIPIELAWIAGYSSWHEGMPFMHYLGNLLSTTDAIPRTISTAIAAGIWIAYVIRSRRVANTFIR